MGFSGRVKNPGLWELPFGTTAREILEDYAGGMRDGLKFKAWQPGGAGTDFLTEAHLDLPMEFESIGKAGSRLGTALAMAVDHEIGMVSLVRNLEEFFARESCGWCTPCRDGLPWSVKILRALERGEGQPGDIETLEQLCRQLPWARAKPSAPTHRVPSSLCRARSNISATSSKRALSSRSAIPMRLAGSSRTC